MAGSRFTALRKSIIISGIFIDYMIKDINWLTDWLILLIWYDLINF